MMLNADRRGPSGGSSLRSLILKRQPRTPHARNSIPAPCLEKSTAPFALETPALLLRSVHLARIIVVSRAGVVCARGLTLPVAIS
jgi:hypothetical protein